MAGIKFGFKVKIVQSYEKLFDDNYFNRLENDDNESTNYWKEFFLLKANPIELEIILRQQLNANQQINQNGNNQQFNKQNGQQQLNHYHKNESNLNLKLDYLIENCIKLLNEDNNKLKQLNSLLTIYCILEVNIKEFKKLKQSLISDENVKKLNLIQLNLLEYYNDKDSKDNEIVKLILKIYLCLICREDDLNDNNQINFLITDNLFDQLLKIIINSRIQELNYLSLILITLLQNYENYELFKIKLSNLDNEIVLNSYAQIISKQLFDFNNEYHKQYNDELNQSSTFNNLLSTLSGLVLNNQSNQDKELTKFDEILIQQDNRCILLSFYDLINLNNNFLPFLLTNNHSFNNLLSIDNHNEQLNETNNLLINFLEFCSIIIFCLKEHHQKNEQLTKKLTMTTRLNLIILTCLVEDQFALKIIHDSTSNLSQFKVNIYRSKMRHRNLNYLNDTTNQTTKLNRPIAHTILDLLIEFLCSNLRKKHFQIDLYIFCNNIILKLLCYQIKFEIRKEYNWNQLWHSLLSLLKYLNSNYDKDDQQDTIQIKRKSKLLLLANNVVNLFNLFIIFGDTFLYSPNDYDDLYYELLRNHDLFNSLIHLSKHYSHSSKKKDEKDSAFKLLNSLDNIETIINHFNLKINESRKNDEILTEEEIREIVRANYDTLSLKVKDGLDIYDIYNYEPEKQFFKKKVLKKINDQIKLTNLTNLDKLKDDQTKIMQSILNK